MQSSDGASARDEGHCPPRWEFDDEVTRTFDDMLARSIPQYEVMRSAVDRVADLFLPRGGRLVDLGCSRGEAIARLTVSRPDVEFVGVEASEPMAAAARTRFGELPLRVIEADISEGLPPRARTANVYLMVLTLQFTPIERRQQILRDVYEGLPSGGALVLVEKVLGRGAALDDVFVRVYHERKVEHGYSPEEVERKRRSLRGVLVPVTAEWNEQLLSRAGFRHVDCFWRWMNFAGWVAIR